MVAELVERPILLSLAHASLLKGAAQMGLVYAARLPRPHYHFAAVQEAIDEVRRQMAEITEERRLTEPGVWVLEEMEEHTAANRRVVGVYRTYEVATEKAGMLARQHGTTIICWSNRSYGDIAGTRDFKWFYQITEHPVRGRAEGE